MYSKPHFDKVPTPSGNPDIEATKAPCHPTPVGTYTATRLIHTLVPTPPYLIEETTLVEWTQSSVCTL
ncbi:hypothetical protein EV121DRAFT_289435 [Schizophyllum commune]